MIGVMPYQEKSMPTTIDIPSGSHAFDNFKNGNETELTYLLKWTAWKWLWEVAEWRVVGFEVRLEGSFGRIADVVGLGPENLVFLIEVKSSRADLRRDDNNEFTQKKLFQKARSLVEAVELTEVVLAKSRALDSPIKAGTARVLAIAESDVEVVAKRLNRPENASTRYERSFTTLAIFVALITNTS